MSNDEIDHVVDITLPSLNTDISIRIVTDKGNLEVFYNVNGKVIVEIWGEKEDFIVI